MKMMEQIVQDLIDSIGSLVRRVGEHQSRCRVVTLISGTQTLCLRAQMYQRESTSTENCITHLGELFVALAASLRVLRPDLDRLTEYQYTKKLGSKAKRLTMYPPSPASNCRKLSLSSRRTRTASINLSICSSLPISCNFTFASSSLMYACLRCERVKDQYLCEITRDDEFEAYLPEFSLRYPILCFTI